MYLDDPQLQPPRPRGPFPCPRKAQTRHEIARARYLEAQRRNRACMRGGPAWWKGLINPATACRRGAARLAGSWARLMARLAR